MEIRRDWITYLAKGMGIDTEVHKGHELETLVVRKMLEQAVRWREKAGVLECVGGCLGVGGRVVDCKKKFPITRGDCRPAQHLVCYVIRSAVCCSSF